MLTLHVPVREAGRIGLLILLTTITTVLTY